MAKKQKTGFPYTNSKTFCNFANGIRKESRHWLRFGVQLSDSKSGNVVNSKIQLLKTILRTDEVNAHAIGMSSLILYCRLYIRSSD